MLFMMCVMTGMIISLNTTIRIDQFLNLNKVFGIGLSGKYFFIHHLQLEVDYDTDKEVLIINLCLKKCCA